MKERSLKYEDRFKAYLFKGEYERFKIICKEMGILNNLKEELEK